MSTATAAAPPSVDAAAPAPAPPLRLQLGRETQRLAAKFDALDAERARHDVLLAAMCDDSTGLTADAERATLSVDHTQWLCPLRRLLSLVAQTLSRNYERGVDVHFDEQVRRMIHAVQVPVTRLCVATHENGDTLHHLVMRYIVLRSLLLEKSVRRALCPPIVTSDQDASIAHQDEDDEQDDDALVDRHAFSVFERRFLKPVFDAHDSGNAYNVEHLVVELTLLWTALLPADPRDRAFARPHSHVVLGNGRVQRLRVPERHWHTTSLGLGAVPSVARVKRARRNT